MDEDSVDFPGAELTAPVRVQDAASDVTTAGNGHLDRSDNETGFHAFVDGPADDPVGEHVLDRADVELALPRPMLRDVAEPQLIRGGGSEVAFHEVVV